jgi:hypothetical protein
MLGFLASYAYFSKEDIPLLRSRLYGAPLFADSGAFSARTLGMEINTALYAKWVWKNLGAFEVYANLDVINNVETSYANQTKLESKGLRPIPAIHCGDPMSALQRYIDDGHDYIALGGLVSGDNGTDVYDWIDKCFKTAGDKAVFHGFGFVRQEAMARWHWYSVDSSSWGSGHRFGQARLFDNGKFISIPLRDKEIIAKNADLIQTHNGDLERFLNSTWHWRDAADINAVSYYRMSEWWASKMGEVKRPNTPTASKAPILYLADGGAINIARAAYAIEKYKRKQI